MIEKRVDICGVKVHNVDINEAVEISKYLVKKERAAAVFTPNGLILLECMKSEEKKELINSAELCIPDGIGVIHAAKRLGTPLKSKVAGVDLALALMDELEKNCGSLFIYGGKPQSLKNALVNIKSKYPKIRCDGIDGFGESYLKVVERINDFKPDVVFVCLGFPKQEKFIAEYKEKLIQGLLLGLGGTVDIISGQSKRAPKWTIDLGLEWLWRSFSEPKRILKIPKLFEFKLRLEVLRKRKRREL